MTKLKKQIQKLLETKSAPKGFHFTKDGKLKRGDADRDGPGGPMLRSDPLDKQRSKVPPVSEASGETYLKHRVSVTVSDPQHTMASKRGEKVEKKIRLLAKSDSDAVTLAKHHYKKQGYKVHDANYIGITEEGNMSLFKQFRAKLEEKTLTPAEKKKREEVAKAIERENPNMPMGMKMAIATKTAKRVAEEELKEAKGLAGMSMDQLKQEHDKVKSKIESEGKSKMISMNHPLSQRARLIRLHMAIKNKQANEEVEFTNLDEAVKTTHENPLVTVHDKDGLHTHANLSTANNIFNTNVKHTDVHKGPVTVTSGREDKNKLKFAISKHHAAALKESEEVEDEGVHYCAKHVRSSLLGDGIVLESQHADPDENGNIEWYLVEFKSGIRKVYTEDLEIMIAEYHGNHKKKRMTNGQ